MDSLGGKSIKWRLKHTLNLTPLPQLSPWKVPCSLPIGSAGKSEDLSPSPLSLPACNIPSPIPSPGVESTKQLYLLQIRQMQGLLIG